MIVIVASYSFVVFFLKVDFPTTQNTVDMNENENSYQVLHIKNVDIMLDIQV